jgi:hypothetical protein
MCVMTDHGRYIKTSPFQEVANPNTPFNHPLSSAPNVVSNRSVMITVNTPTLAKINRVNMLPASHWRFKSSHILRRNQ